MSTFSPSAATMTTTIPRGPPEVVTFRYQQEQMGSPMAYVALAGSHEEAQDIAARSFPSLATVDPQWLFFTITIRYKSTNERKEIGISPAAWVYVTNKLVPYRVIDVHVVPPSLSPHSSTSKSHAPLYPDSPLKAQVPPYHDTSPAKGNVPPYPDSPPPKYPGSPQKQLHPHVPPYGQGHGYGYGFGWQDQISNQPARDYNEPRGYNRPEVDPQEMADQRSMGWSGSSVKVQGGGWGGNGLFSRFRQNGFGIFPITWDDKPRGGGSGRRRRHSHRESPRDRVRDYEQMHENGSGRSYVPSLI